MLNINPKKYVPLLLIIILTEKLVYSKSKKQKNTKVFTSQTPVVEAISFPKASFRCKNNLFLKICFPNCLFKQRVSVFSSLYKQFYDMFMLSGAKKAFSLRVFSLTKKIESPVIQNRTTFKNSMNFSFLFSNKQRQFSALEYICMFYILAQPLCVDIIKSKILH